MPRLYQRVRSYQRKEFPKLRRYLQQLPETNQTPRALFITCSDSLVDPYRLTSSFAGELSVIRNFGNVVSKPGSDDGMAAAIEYAVRELAVPEIVICGHSHCSAMKAVRDSRESRPQTPPVPCLDRQLHELPLKLDSLWELAVANVQLQVERLYEYPLVARAAVLGDLQISAWCYRSETGEVIELGKRQDETSAMPN